MNSDSITYMRLHPLLSVFLLSLFFLSCDSPSKETDDFHNLGEAEIVLEANASTWFTYKGNIPCDDCEEINLELKLENKMNNEEKGFELIETYIGTKHGDRSFNSRGTYEIIHGLDNDPTAVVLTLMDENKVVTKAFVQEDEQNLRLVEKDGKRFNFPLNYSLKKQ